LITIAFTFLPILILASLPWANESLFENYWSNFQRYWASGELSLPIWGLCGTIFISIFFYNKLRSWHWLVLLGMFVITLLIGNAVSESNGFTEPLNEIIIYYGFVIYFVLVVIWIYLIATRELPETEPRNSGKSSQELLEKVNKVRASNGD